MIIKHVERAILVANLQIIVFALAIYIINSYFKGKIEIHWIDLICTSYLNDYMGGLFFISFVNVLFYYAYSA